MIELFEQSVKTNDRQSSKEIIERVKIIIFEQMRKYQYLF